MVFCSFVFAQASDLNQVILLDGSVARCSLREDIGNRIYRLTVKSVTSDLSDLTVESLVCSETKAGFTLSGQTLTQSETYAKKGSVLVNDFSSPVLQVTNTEGTRELAKLQLNADVAVQTVQLDLQQLKNITSRAKVDITLQMIKTVTVNGKFLDERIVSGGHYRINIR